MPFVLDASIAALWALADESDTLAEAVLLEWMLRPDEQDAAYVPALFWFEIRNVLSVSERRKRINASETDSFLRVAASFPIIEDELRYDTETFKLARRWQLSFYDASYLELAIRKHLPLATLDKALRTAADKSGIPLWRGTILP